MEFMKRFVLESADVNPHKNIDVEPFTFDKSCASSPSLFEIDFLYGDTRYVYGFSADTEKIQNEWFHSYPKGKRVIIFERTPESHNPSRHVYKFNRSHVKLNKFANKTLANSLLISVSARSNPTAAIVSNWFSSQMNLLSELDQDKMVNFTAMLLRTDEEATKSFILSCLKKLEMDISDIRIVKKTSLHNVMAQSSNTPAIDTADEQMGLYFIHQLRNSMGLKKEMPLAIERESAGMRSFVYILARVLDSIISHSVLFSDEIDLRIHPVLSKWLLDFFHLKELDTKAQLVLTTHNTNIMDLRLIRHDQIWFVAKDRFTGASTLFCLSDFNRPKGALYRKNYLEGRYGIIPIIEHFKELQ